MLAYTGAANKKQAQEPLRKIFPMHPAAAFPLPLYTDLAAVFHQSRKRPPQGRELLPHSVELNLFLSAPLDHLLYGRIRLPVILKIPCVNRRNDGVHHPRYVRADPH